MLVGGIVLLNVFEDLWGFPVSYPYSTIEGFSMGLLRSLLDLDWSHTITWICLRSLEKIYISLNSIKQPFSKSANRTRKSSQSKPRGFQTKQKKSRFVSFFIFVSLPFFKRRRRCLPMVRASKPLSASLGVRRPKPGG